MKYFFLLTALLVHASIFAQQSPYSTNSKQAIKYFALASQAIDEHLYDDAIEQLNKAIDIDKKFIEAHDALADVYRLRKQYNEAIRQYRQVIELNPEFSHSIYLKLGEIEVTSAAYQPARQHLEKYLTYPATNARSELLAKKLISDCDFSINALQHPVTFKPVNLGPEINSSDDEYSPAITADENTLIFTRKINNNEDFYKSDKVSGKWQTATGLSDQINTPRYNEGAMSISQDGKYLFFTGCNRPDGLGRCDIYLAQKKGDNWAKPFDLSSPVNTPGWEAQPSVSADGRTLFFVSNRKGGYGGYDLWKSTLTDKGWGEPENLGPNINTAFDEQTPFIHPDDSTLYFSSNGWPGMGNMDLFVSHLGKDGQWQKPENLGSPINTSGDEGGLITTTNGNFAFFSSNKLNGNGGFDIYTFELPSQFRPRKVTYVKGLVEDSKTNEPLEAAVEIIDLVKNKDVYQDYSDAANGDFLATLVTGKNYGLQISKTGYLFHSENFSLVGHPADKAFNIKVLLEPIEVGNKVILKNVFFDTNQFQIKAESEAELGKLIDFLNVNPQVLIEISGHTDNIGSDELNQTLSENRAKAVYQYLVAHGINANRLLYKGYGKTQPVLPNDNDENRSNNRRTEFKIIAK